MKKRIYKAPLTCADHVLVGMGQIMVDSTSKSLNPTDGNNKPKFLIKFVH